MTLKFEGSDNHTIGVEIELQIINPETLDLTPQSELILQNCQQLGIQRVKAEIHQSMLEIDSEISSDVKQCRQFLFKRLKSLNHVAKSFGLKLAALGTHPFQRWGDRLISHQDRYQQLYQKFQWLARRMNVYGLHVHIGVKSGEQALRISNNMMNYLPHLLALSANSPYWQGSDTGMQSCRVNIMEAFPNAGIPPYFNCWSELEYFHETLKNSSAIGSLKDLYWYIRPNLHFGTIEFRVCDAMNSLKHTMALVALIQSLVVWTEEKPERHKWTKEKQWVAPENQWVAAKDGLEGMIIVNSEGKKEKISDQIYGLLDELRPIARSLNCLEELEDIKEILTLGNGAQRQRMHFAEKQSLIELMKYSVDEFESNLLDPTENCV